MRLNGLRLLALMTAFTSAGFVRADDNGAKAREVIDKAIEAHGGEAELKKLNAISMKIKGMVHVMGLDIPFTGDSWHLGQDQQRVDLEIEVMNMKISVSNVVNKDKGWAKANGEVMEMTKDQMTEAREQAYGTFITTFLPLKDKAYKLSLVGDDKVEKTEAVVIRVEHKDHRDHSLFFDKKTYLLLKTETRAKDEGGMEVNQEIFFENYNDKGLRQPRKMTIKRDGKKFLEMEISDLRVDEKFDESSFGKPQ